MGRQSPHPEEFRRDAVALYRAAGGTRTYAAVAAELGTTGTQTRLELLHAALVLQPAPTNAWREQPFDIPSGQPSIDEMANYDSSRRDDLGFSARLWPSTARSHTDVERPRATRGGIARRPGPLPRSAGAADL